uniref:Alpha/beta hydrolase fold-3 domain-containing protein n=1 Tax=Tanacetum cinerariifolium TaxID=118510 RepID=A0A699HFD1_TANCI|nr:hypothetical protein [Tanacetum cinerariifolium]
MVVIFDEYHLAPEHRLPVAYKDVMGAVLWVRNQALGINGCDEWLTRITDFSRVCLMGSSVGGNIAYNACLRALDLDLNPIKIVGSNALNQSFDYEKIRLLPQYLIRGYGGDPLVDRQRKFATMLETLGVHLITKFDDEGYHGVDMFDRRKAQVLYNDIKSFIWSLVKNKSSL